MDDIFELLARRCDEHGYTDACGDDLDEWASGCDLNISDFLDQFGLEVAQRYHEKELSFAFCDSLVNDLYAHMVDRSVAAPDFRWPSIFFEVFEAFDAGEFHRRADKSDDPIGELTDPAIASIIARVR